MKFLHISDLHIGKRVNEFSMIEDQKYILNQIISISEEENADAVLIAGDIYDKPIPSAEAVQVFDHFLTSLADRNKKVFIISGNHDSPERIAFGARLMEGRGVYVSPVYDGTIARVPLEDEYGELFIYMLPFLKPSVVRHVLQRESEEHLPESYQEALESVLKRAEVDRKKRNVILVHQFVTGADRCESEEVAVGGVDQIDAELFDAFDYVALGHIHSPQSVRRDAVRYCGTPLKYSFSESDQKKTVTVIDVREKGQLELCFIPIAPLHDLRILRGTYLEVTDRAFYQDLNQEDYMKVILTDEEDVPDGMQKLRIIYPNLMRLEYDNSRTRENQVIEGVNDARQKSELELFEEFYELQNNKEMSLEQRGYLMQLLEDIREE